MLSLLPRAWATRIRKAHAVATGTAHAARAPLRPIVLQRHSPEVLEQLRLQAVADRDARRTRSANADRADLRARFRDMSVIDIQRHGKEAITLHFANDGPDAITFEPGQFLTLVVMIRGEEHRRAYSFCSDPARPETVAVTIKRVQGGRVSNHLNDVVRVGDTLRTLGPSGVFGPRRTRPASSRVILVGGGSGITPLMAIVHAQRAAPSCAGIHLVYANRGARSVIFLDQLSAIAAVDPRVTIRHVLERPSKRLPAARGRLTGDTLRAEVPVDPGATYFVCGPGPMMDAVSMYLESAGVPSTQIFMERFVPQDRRRDAASKGAVYSVSFRRSGLLLQVRDDTTLLDAALDAGIDLPFSCTMGGCGACRQRVREGACHVEEPNCLTMTEREEGFVLTCVSRPRGALVIDA